MIEAKVVKLTPEYAGELLAKNRKNRPFSAATVERYERTITNGDWRLNGETIILFKDGTLADGQHRCQAVVNTGIAIDVLLVGGIDESSFNSINDGKRRTAADVLHIDGNINTKTLASAARTYVMSKLTGSEINFINSSEIAKCVKEHPHLTYWTQRYCASNKGKIIPAFYCGYLAIASEKYGFEKLDKFFDDVVNGTNLSKTDPAFQLRERFISQTKVSRLSQTHARAFVVKAINACVLNKKMSFLRFSPDEPTPVII
jgi:hypothetical protein